ncbi:Ger(x)C family spore germination protein [Cytobacillus sp. NCCP-133]|uniref:Ger(x)C family spore germination protein n=1 Tax=Cytobacillus sp. NCCP-133 TaxID=766848 RepID=UPI00222EC143|nr:Ger(x)C family spore germination protein [Cytobacillus sp. NCCP-133]GLB61816.1 hypothetical protein NCCP133_39450 [Cytobacillus sp. NCCP-133]
MNRKIALVIMIFLLLNFLSGCWSRSEMNELAITVGLAIDKPDDQFIITTQVVNPGQAAARQGGGQKTPVITYQEKGDTVFETIRRMTTVTARKLYFSHIRILVISEELAEEGLGEVLDFLIRDHNVRSDFYVVIAKDTKAENVLKVLTGLEDIPANKLFTALETSEKSWAPSRAVAIDELIVDIVAEGKEAQLTGLEITGDIKKAEKSEHVQEIEPDVTLKYSGLAVFKGDKLIGWLNESDSKAVNYVQGNVKSTIGETSCPDGKGKVAIEVIRTKADLKAKVENGSPKGTINVQIEGNVGDVQCRNLDLSKMKTIEELEKKSEKIVKELIESTIAKAQGEFKADIFGFGEAIHRSDPDYWKKVKKEWNEKFADMPIEVKAAVKIRRVGTIGNSPMKGMEE